MGNRESKKLAALSEMRRNQQKLLESIKMHLTELKELIKTCGSQCEQELAMNRFYRQSFKVYRIQNSTEKIVEILIKIMPEQKLEDWFMQIISEGTGRAFKIEDNSNWLAVTRPIIEAYFHSRFFLEMAIRYGEEFESVPVENRPYGWVALLDLYNVR